ncbi:MAG: hypothetical protein J1F37_05145 [Oscillospiraceae bacterium]|nr:hypothetical protein [Oscillospiraceae bacterium]
MKNKDLKNNKNNSLKNNNIQAKISDVTDNSSSFDKFIDLIQEFRFFKNQDNKLYFLFEGDYYEANEKNLKDQLRLAYIKTYKKNFIDSTLDNIVKGTITEQEKYCETQCDTAYRIYYNKQNNEIYYDFGNDKIAKISNSEIKIITKDKINGVAFLKATNALPQIIPEIKELSPAECKDILSNISKFVNVKDLNTLKVIIIYIILTFIQNISHPILMFCGNQGSSKTTSTKYIRRIVDPSSNEVIAFPNQKDLEMVLGNHYFCAFDNLGDFSVKQDVSNLLCCAVTGATILRRRLYTDNAEMSLRLKNIIILNGIAPNVSRNDLIERSIIVKMDSISKSQRKKDWELEEEFNSLLPDFLNAIFNILRMYLAKKDSYEISDLARMADFEEAGIIIDDILQDDIEDGLSFDYIYENMVADEQNEAVYIDPFVSFIHSYLEVCGSIEGTPTEVFNKIKSKNYSQYSINSANVFVKRLKEKEDLLNQANIKFVNKRYKNRYLKIYLENEDNETKNDFDFSAVLSAEEEIDNF